jgi:signal transduction histidine kinase
VRERATRVLTSLTAKYVAVFTLLVAVPAIGISWYLLDSSYNDNKRALIKQQQAEAKALAGTVTQFLGAVVAQLKATQVSGRSEDVVEHVVLRPLLLDARTTPGDVFYASRPGTASHEIGALAPESQGFVVRRTVPKLITPKQFAQARARPFVSSVHLPPGESINQGNGFEDFIFDVVTAENSGPGVIGESISWGTLRDLLAGTGVIHAGYAYVTDTAGRAIIAPSVGEQEENVDFRPQTAGLPQVKAALASSTGALAGGEDFRGRKVLTAWATVDPAGWKVFVEQPESAALAPLSGKIWRTALIIAGFVALAVALSILLARRLVRPIKRLQVAAEAIGAGAYDERIELDRKDELGALASAFNQMTERVQELIEGLERRVAERTRELAQASRHKSEFLANMSHELRTPLNAILGFTQVLQQKLFGEVNDKQEEYLADIHSSANHLLELINDVLDLSKVEAGQVELEKISFSLREALERGVVMVRERALKNGVQLALEPDPNVEFVEADERRIRQVVFNLLSNAVKFTPAGGSVVVGSAQQNGEVLVSVKDTGPGIAPEDQERIFEEFQQTDVGAEQREGTGLGLALSRKLVELHGGRIWVESQPGHGSTFTFTLPLEATT